MKYEDNTFSTYRDILMKSGLIDMTSYGSVGLSLPLFNEYVRNYC